MRATSPKLRVDEEGGGSFIRIESPRGEDLKKLAAVSLLMLVVAKCMLSING